ncbi:MAG: hypothetical protein WCE79_13430 [Xanthobacteraceae bacterium]
MDQGVPVPLRRAFSSHTVSTAYERDWAELSNGALLKRAEAEFDVLITTDQGLRFQQNLAEFRLAIVVLPTTDWSIIAQHQEAIVAATASARTGEALVLSWR